MSRRWVAALVLLAACSSRTPAAKGPSLPTADIPAAVAAVQAVAPGAQFTEINLSPEGVTLFVVSSQGKEKSYLYAAAKLGEPSGEQPAEGDPFPIAGVPLDQATKVVAFATKQFAGATVTSVALVVVKPSGLVWAVRSQSTRGGLLNSLFSPDGKIISSLPAN